MPGPQVPLKFAAVAGPIASHVTAVPDKITGTKTKILDMIRANLRVRGVKADDKELEALVDLRTRDESCYEFAHVTTANWLTPS